MDQTNSWTGRCLSGFAYGLLVFGMGLALASPAHWDIGGLADKARSGKLTFSETEGECFSVTNLGSLGGTGFTPTINALEVAVLGMARSAREMVDGAFVPQLMLPLTLAYDHRVIDGAVGGRFVQDLRQRLAGPAALAT